MGENIQARLFNGSLGWHNNEVPNDVDKLPQTLYAGQMAICNKDDFIAGLPLGHDDGNERGEFTDQMRLWDES